MLLTIPAVLTADEVADFRRVLDGASWVDGKVTAGYQSAAAKQNLQLPETAPEARELGERVLAALPLKVFPPLFNRYGVGHGFGSHVDNAIRPVRGTWARASPTRRTRAKRGRTRRSTRWPRTACWTRRRCG